MGSTKKYWKGIEELKETPAFLEQRDQEFPAQSAIESFLLDEKLAEASTGRRDFLKFLGFSVVAQLWLLAKLLSQKRCLMLTSLRM